MQRNRFRLPANREPGQQHVVAADALAHPTWSMGAKITIDSATLMNKGLEVVEARWLFDIPASKIEVVVHRESIIHSLVEYQDRSVIAQLGLPDMRTPIAYAMNYPERVPLDLPSLNLAQIGTLTFFNPDHDLFPCLGLGFEHARVGEVLARAPGDELLPEREARANDQDNMIISIC
jgi:1-deoxy-D-xylulose-5-phosphate reductoisomerase